MAQKKQLDNNTEQAILEAAGKVFTQKGYAAARMEDIAKEAGINRALLHYYFRSKDKMFDIVFEKRFIEFFSGFAGILMGNMGLFDKIRNLVSYEIGMIAEHPDLPLFIIGELSLNPQRLINRVAQTGAPVKMIPQVFEKDVQLEISKGSIHPIDGSQLLINVLSLCVFPFIARPMLQFVIGMDEAAFFEMIEKRKVEVADFILASISK